MTIMHLAPGCWVDSDDPETLHMDLPTMCAAAGFPPTEENMATLERATRDAFEKHYRRGVEYVREEKP